MKKRVISLVLPVIALAGLSAAALTPQTHETQGNVVGRGLPPIIIDTKGLPPIADPSTKK